jgi:hypothetical protein
MKEEPPITAEEQQAYNAGRALVAETEPPSEEYRQHFYEAVIDEAVLELMWMGAPVEGLLERIKQSFELAIERMREDSDEVH